MASLKTIMGFAAFEPGLQGPWPKDKYDELLSIQIQILDALGLTSGAFTRLEPRWCKLLAERSDMMHPAFVRPLFFLLSSPSGVRWKRTREAQIADCLALFALLDQCLAAGTAVPPTMPIFERLAYHHACRRRQLASATPSRDRQGENWVKQERTGGNEEELSETHGAVRCVLDE
jgi:hypothetical protein